jgi:hypothetical protein
LYGQGGNDPVPAYVQCGWTLSEFGHAKWEPGVGGWILTVMLIHTSVITEMGCGERRFGWVSKEEVSTSAPRGWVALGGSYAFIQHVRSEKYCTLPSKSA